VTPHGEQTSLVLQAFRAIGSPGRDWRREVALIAKAIRELGDEEALALFGISGEPEREPCFRQPPTTVLWRLRSGLVRRGVALDLYTAVVNPNWAPFGGRPYYEAA
jgi:hypothetical protein